MSLDGGVEKKWILMMNEGLRTKIMIILGHVGYQL